MRKLQTEIVSGWKDIANYLGKAVRTAQRYEREFALPVHRPAGKLKGSVIAAKADLDHWVADSPTRKPLVPNQTNIDAVVLSDFKRNIAELGRLRGISAGSRQALAQSRHDLAETLKSVTSNIQSGKKKIG